MLPLAAFFPDLFAASGISNKVSVHFLSSSITFFPHGGKTAGFGGTEMKPLWEERCGCYVVSECAM